MATEADFPAPICETRKEGGDARDELLTVEGEKFLTIPSAGEVCSKIGSIGSEVGKVAGSIDLDQVVKYEHVISVLKSDDQPLESAIREGASSIQGNAGESNASENEGGRCTVPVVANLNRDVSADDKNEAEMLARESSEDKPKSLLDNKVTDHNYVKLEEKCNEKSQEMEVSTGKDESHDKEAFDKDDERIVRDEAQTEDGPVKKAELCVQQVDKEEDDDSPQQKCESYLEKETAETSTEALVEEQVRGADPLEITRGETNEASNEVIDAKNGTVEVLKTTDATGAKEETHKNKEGATAIFHDDAKEEPLAGVECSKAKHTEHLHEESESSFHAENRAVDTTEDTLVDEGVQVEKAINSLQDSCNDVEAIPSDHVSGNKNEQKTTDAENETILELQENVGSTANEDYGQNLPAREDGSGKPPSEEAASTGYDLKEPVPDQDTEACSSELEKTKDVEKVVDKLSLVQEPAECSAESSLVKEETSSIQVAREVISEPTPGQQIETSSIKEHNSPQEILIAQTEGETTDEAIEESFDVKGSGSPLLTKKTQTGDSAETILVNKEVQVETDTCDNVEALPSNHNVGTSSVNEDTSSGDKNDEKAFTGPETDTLKLQENVRSITNEDNGQNLPAGEDGSGKPPSEEEASTGYDLKEPVPDQDTEACSAELEKTEDVEKVVEKLCLVQDPAGCSAESSLVKEGTSSIQVAREVISEPTSGQQVETSSIKEHNNPQEILIAKTKGETTDEAIEESFDVKGSESPLLTKKTQTGDSAETILVNKEVQVETDTCDNVKALPSNHNVGTSSINEDTSSGDQNEEKTFTGHETDTLKLQENVRNITNEGGEGDLQKQPLEEAFMGNAGDYKLTTAHDVDESMPNSENERIVECELEKEEVCLESPQVSGNDNTQASTIEEHDATPDPQEISMAETEVETTSATPITVETRDPEKIIGEHAEYKRNNEMDKEPATGIPHDNSEDNLVIQADCTKAELTDHLEKKSESLLPIETTRDATENTSANEGDQVEKPIYSLQESSNDVKGVLPTQETGVEEQLPTAVLPEVLVHESVEKAVDAENEAIPEDNLTSISSEDNEHKLPVGEDCSQQPPSEEAAPSNANDNNLTTVQDIVYADETTADTPELVKNEESGECALGKEEVSIHSLHAASKDTKASALVQDIETCSVEELSTDANNEGVTGHQVEDKAANSAETREDKVIENEEDKTSKATNSNEEATTVELTFDEQMKEALTKNTGEGDSALTHEAELSEKNADQLLINDEVSIEPSQVEAKDVIGIECASSQDREMKSALEEENLPVNPENVLDVHEEHEGNDKTDSKEETPENKNAAITISPRQMDFLQLESEQHLENVCENSSLSEQPKDNPTESSLVEEAEVKCVDSLRIFNGENEVLASGQDIDISSVEVSIPTPDQEISRVKTEGESPEAVGRSAGTSIVQESATEEPASTLLPDDILPKSCKASEVYHSSSRDVEQQDEIKHIETKTEDSKEEVITQIQRDVVQKDEINMRETYEADKTEKVYEVIEEAVKEPKENIVEKESVEGSMHKEELGSSVQQIPSVLDADAHVVDHKYAKAKDEESREVKVTETKYQRDKIKQDESSMEETSELKRVGSETEKVEPTDQLEKESENLLLIETTRDATENTSANEGDQVEKPIYSLQESSDDVKGVLPTQETGGEEQVPTAGLPEVLVHVSVEKAIDAVHKNEPIPEQDNVTSIPSEGEDEESREVKVRETEYKEDKIKQDDSSMEETSKLKRVGSETEKVCKIAEGSSDESGREPEESSSESIDDVATTINTDEIHREDAIKKTATNTEDITEVRDNADEIEKASKACEEATEKHIQESEENVSPNVDRFPHHNGLGESVEEDANVLDTEEGNQVDHISTECKYEDPKEVIVAACHIEDGVVEHKEAHTEETCEVVNNEDGTERAPDVSDEVVQGPEENFVAAHESIDRSLQLKELGKSIKEVSNLVAADEAHGTNQETETGNSREGILTENYPECEAKQLDISSEERCEVKMVASEIEEVSKNVREPFEKSGQEQETNKLENVDTTHGEDSLHTETTGDLLGKASKDFEEIAHENREETEEALQTNELVDKSLYQKDPEKSFDEVTTIVDTEEAHRADHVHTEIRTEDAREGLITESQQENQVKEEEINTREIYEVKNSSEETQKVPEVVEDDVKEPEEKFVEKELIDGSLCIEELGNNVQQVPSISDSEDAHTVAHPYAEIEGEESRDVKVTEHDQVDKAKQDESNTEELKELMAIGCETEKVEPSNVSVKEPKESITESIEVNAEEIHREDSGCTETKAEDSGEMAMMESHDREDEASKTCEVTTGKHAQESEENASPNIDRSPQHNDLGESTKEAAAVIEAEEGNQQDHVNAESKYEDSKEVIEAASHIEYVVEHKEANTEEIYEVRNDADGTERALEVSDQGVHGLEENFVAAHESIDRSLQQQELVKSMEEVTGSVAAEEACGTDQVYQETESENLVKEILIESHPACEAKQLETSAEEICEDKTIENETEEVPKNVEETSDKSMQEPEENRFANVDSAHGEGNACTETTEDLVEKASRDFEEVDGEDQEKTEEILLEKENSLHQKEPEKSFEEITNIVNTEEAHQADHIHTEIRTEDSREGLRTEENLEKEEEINTREIYEVGNSTEEIEKVSEVTKESVRELEESFVKKEPIEAHPVDHQYAEIKGEASQEVIVTESEREDKIEHDDSKREEICEDKRIESEPEKVSKIAEKPSDESVQEPEESRTKSTDDIETAFNIEETHGEDSACTETKIEDSEEKVITEIHHLDEPKEMNKKGISEAKEKANGTEMDPKSCEEATEKDVQESEENVSENVDRSTLQYELGECIKEVAVVDTEEVDPLNHVYVESKFEDAKDVIPVKTHTEDEAEHKEGNTEEICEVGHNVNRTEEAPKVFEEAVQGPLENFVAPQKSVDSSVQQELEDSIKGVTALVAAEEPHGADPVYLETTGIKDPRKEIVSGSYTESEVKQEDINTEEICEIKNLSSETEEVSKIVEESSEKSEQKPDENVSANIKSVHGEYNVCTETIEGLVEKEYSSENSERSLQPRELGKSIEEATTILNIEEVHGEDNSREKIITESPHADELKPEDMFEVTKTETEVSEEAAEKAVEEPQKLLEEVDAVTATTPVIGNYCRVDHVPIQTGFEDSKEEVTCSTEVDDNRTNTNDVGNETVKDGGLSNQQSNISVADATAEQQEPHNENELREAAPTKTVGKTEDFEGEKEKEDTIAMEQQEEENKTKHEQFPPSEFTHGKESEKLGQKDEGFNLDRVKVENEETPPLSEGKGEVDTQKADTCSKPTEDKDRDVHVEVEKVSEVFGEAAETTTILNTEEVHGRDSLGEQTITESYCEDEVKPEDVLNVTKSGNETKMECEVSEEAAEMAAEEPQKPAEEVDETISTSDIEMDHKVDHVHTKTGFDDSKEVVISSAQMENIRGRADYVDNETTKDGGLSDQHSNMSVIDAAEEQLKIHDKNVICVAAPTETVDQTNVDFEGTGEKADTVATEQKDEESTGKHEGLPHGDFTQGKDSEKLGQEDEVYNSDEMQVGNEENLLLSQGRGKEDAYVADICSQPTKDEDRNIYSKLNKVDFSSHAEESSEVSHASAAQDIPRDNENADHEYSGENCPNKGTESPIPTVEGGDEQSEQASKATGVTAAVQEMIVRTDPGTLPEPAEVGIQQEEDVSHISRGMTGSSTSTEPAKTLASESVQEGTAEASSDAKDQLLKIHCLPQESIVEYSEFEVPQTDCRDLDLVRGIGENVKDSSKCSIGVTNNENLVGFIPDANKGVTLSNEVQGVEDFHYVITPETLERDIEEKQPMRTQNADPEAKGVDSKEEKTIGDQCSDLTETSHDSEKEEICEDKDQGRVLIASPPILPQTERSDIETTKKDIPVDLLGLDDTGVTVAEVCTLPAKDKHVVQEVDHPKNVNLDHSTTNTVPQYGDITECHPSNDKLQCEHEESATLETTKSTQKFEEILKFEQDEAKCVREEIIQEATKSLERSELQEIDKPSLSDILQPTARETINPVASKEPVVHNDDHQADGKQGEADQDCVKTDEEHEGGEKSIEHETPNLGSEAPMMVDAEEVKVAHKKSHGILSGVGSKVKHSISKVKKAITGKSSHSKSSSPTKGNNQH